MKKTIIPSQQVAEVWNELLRRMDERAKPPRPSSIFKCDHCGRPVPDGPGYFCDMCKGEDEL